MRKDMSASEPPKATSAGVRYLALASLVAAIAFAFAPQASAGPYEAVQCAAHLGAGHGGFHFSRNSLDFHGVRTCGSADGLGVTHQRSRTGPGGYGVWVAKPPAGTYFTRGRLVARGRRAGAYRPRLLLGAPQHAPASIGSPGRGFRAFEWRAGSRADRLIAQLTCARRTGRCGRTDKPKLYVKRARFRLFDASPPAVTGLGGALLGAPVQRATQALTLEARDAGSGVRMVQVRTNRKLFDSLGSSCNIGAHQLALGLSPCPNFVRTSVSVNTLLPGFHEGQNSITVCAHDYANASPNERCAKRRIRVDNDCPISDPAPELRAHFAFAGGKMVKRVKFSRRPRVVGRFARPSGGPGQGALVCVSERPVLTNSTERLVGPPLRTDARGRISARLPAGPSRIVYLTYWRGAERVVSRSIRLRVKPSLGLRVRPRGGLHNGQTMILRARLRGPFHAHRKVRFLANPPGGRWVPFSTDFVQRTNQHGVAHVSHTFRHVSGTQKFRFKVSVPHQPGYPYVAGHSHVRRKTVTAG
jgi:hypothetical protein